MDKNLFYFNVWRDDQGNEWTCEKEVVNKRVDALAQIDANDNWDYVHTIFVDLKSRYSKQVDLIKSRQIADLIRGDRPEPTKSVCDYRSTTVGEI